MLLIAMLFVLLVLGPLTILAALAVADDGRALAWVARLRARRAGARRAADPPHGEADE